MAVKPEEMHAKLAYEAAVYREQLRLLKKEMDRINVTTVELSTAVKTIENLDPELFKAVESARELAMTDGALPGKYKYLIAMVLDATHGAAEGVHNLAQAAIHAGATREEIAEALRVAYFIDGVGCIYTASRGLSGIF